MARPCDGIGVTPRGGSGSGRGRVWTVPAKRAKTNGRHRVSLCGRALEIPELDQALGEGAGPLVFTHGGGKALRDSRLCRLLCEQGIAAVTHGFRSSFRD